MITILPLPFLRNHGKILIFGSGKIFKGAKPTSVIDQRLRRTLVDSLYSNPMSLLIGALCGVLVCAYTAYVSDDEFTIDEKAASKNLGADAVPVLDATIAAVESLDSFTTAALQDALNAALVDDLGLKPRKAFGPVRVAVTGSQVSPPLFESMEILGRDKTLARLASAREIAAK